MSHPDIHKPVFKNLDGIRFIAFLCVFFSHTFYSRDIAITSNPFYQSINFLAGPWGDLGLSVFFVMSGFLITYLLMYERQATGKVHVLSFYTRRILRIWPLYFVLVLFNFFVYAPITNNHPLENRQLPFYFFYANQDIINHGFSNGIIDHLWAISVEEQFYLVLPLLMVFFPDKRLNYVFFVALIGAQIFRAIHYAEPAVIFFHSVSASFEIAIGGLAAWLMFFNSKAKEFISNISLKTIIATYGLFVLMVLFQRSIFSPSYLIMLVLMAQLFAVFIILEQTYATHSFLKIGKVKWVSNLGKYSYGFFCYHILCIRIIETVAAKIGATGVVATTLVIPLTGLALTIGTGVASYHFFEMRFLNLKKKFSYLT